MNIYKSESMTVVADDGIIHYIIDRNDPHTANYADKRGKTGAAVWTLKGEDIRKNKPVCTPYNEHNSVDEKLDGLKSNITLDDMGLRIDLSVDNDNVSEFGVMLDLNMMSKLTDTPFERQVLPTSPYTSPDGKVMYCIFTRPDGRCLVAAAVTVCDGWKIQYSPEALGHFINSFSFLASFDDSYGGSGRKSVSVVLTPAENVEEAYAKIGGIFGKSFAVPVVSGTFGGDTYVKVSDGVDSLEVTESDGSTSVIKTDRNIVPVKLNAYGFATVTPVKNGERGIPAIVWNGVSMDGCWTKNSESTSEIYHGDTNLCEGGCWTWALARYLKTHENGRLTAAVLDDLRTITGERKTYVVRRTISPEAQNGYAPYHIFDSNRIQEQYFGVSILLDSYRLFHVDEYLDLASKALDELIDNWMTPDGAVMKGDEEYTTVTCLVIPVVDMALEFKGKDEKKYEKYRKAAIAMADHVVARGFDFPTEGCRTERVEMEDGSISCTALTVLYVAAHLEYKPEYIEFGKKILDIHGAWKMYSPDARIYGSSLRWWETIWEGDATGPNICGGHAWTIWRAEALYWYAVQTGDAAAMVDSWNGFITNFAKIKENGDSYSCYIPDYICGGGVDGIRRSLMTWPKLEGLKQYHVVHDYPETPDYSLSRYAWARAYDTWVKTAAVVDVNGVPTALNCRVDGKKIITEDSVKVIYVSESLKDMGYTSGTEIKVLGK